MLTIIPSLSEFYLILHKINLMIDIPKNLLHRIWYGPWYGYNNIHQKYVGINTKLNRKTSMKGTKTNPNSCASKNKVQILFMKINISQYWVNSMIATHGINTKRKFFSQGNILNGFFFKNTMYRTVYFSSIFLVILLWMPEELD